MENQVIIGALFQEGTSQVRPPYFNGQHFSHWKVRMEIYAMAYDVKVWRVIKKGNYPLPVVAQPFTDPEDIDSYTDEKMAVVQVNNKARNLLYNAISGEEYEKISSYDTDKEMWDKLEVTYEGTSKGKETHINMLVHDYEPFQMKEEESIEEMFAKFSKIMSDLKAFGKPYSSGDQLSYDVLRGELIAFEKTHLNKKNQEEKKKIFAFKAITEIAENDIDDDPEVLKEEIAMMSRNMDSLMRRFRNMRRGRIPPRRSRQYNEQDKNDGKCYECGRFGHIQAECPDLKRKNSRGFNKNKSFGSWNDEDSSEHEEIDAGQMRTLETSEYKDNNENYFMARGETSEVRFYNCKRCNELQDILDLTLKQSQKMMNELKRLNKEVKDWKLKHKIHICLTSISDDPWLWHRKLGHASMHLIEKLSKHELVIGLPKRNFSRNHICDACQIRKQTRNYFKNKDIVSASNPLQLLHMDLFGPTRTASIGGKRYAFVIVDDYSRFTWVIFLSYKDEVLKNFKSFCKKVERKRESVYVIFYESNSSTEKGITAGDEDQAQEVQETSKSQKSTDGSDVAIKSTSETSNNPPEPPKESTTHIVRPNE
ncbi:uncharacterized protein LOC142180827 [Nicotiana tabacum]|uniref:Uncharacterized protein LOC142180827 n=1 Tax=Nicotiana tabacum TaxID=4097 RepID=A0AC58UHQ8_TOBAC